MRRCSGSWTTRKAQFCAFPADGARIAASRIAVSTASGTGSGLNRRTARAVWIASNTPSSVTPPSYPEIHALLALE